MTEQYREKSPAAITVLNSHVLMNNHFCQSLCNTSLGFIMEKISERMKDKGGWKEMCVPVLFSIFFHLIHAFERNYTVLQLPITFSK